MVGSGRKGPRTRVKSSTDENDDDSLRSAKPNLKLRKDRSRDHSFIRIFNVNVKVMLGLSVLAFFVVFFLIRRLVNPAEVARRPRVVTPFTAPKLMDLPQDSTVFDYRIDVDWCKDGTYSMRHVCQDSDEPECWTHHNGRDFG